MKIKIGIESEEPLTGEALGAAVQAVNLVLSNLCKGRKTNEQNESFAVSCDADGLTDAPALEPIIAPPSDDLDALNKDDLIALAVAKAGGDTAQDFTKFRKSELIEFLTD
tara:strand:- start:390 stop:719 length:330 start_codon:yes stop_codon:yes gene_type:complete